MGQWLADFIGAVLIGRHAAEGEVFRGMVDDNLGPGGGLSLALEADRAEDPRLAAQGHVQALRGGTGCLEEIEECDSARVPRFVDHVAEAGDVLLPAEKVAEHGDRSLGASRLGEQAVYGRAGGAMKGSAERAEPGSDDGIGVRVNRGGDAGRKRRCCEAVVGGEYESGIESGDTSRCRRFAGQGGPQPRSEALHDRR